MTPDDKRNAERSMERKGRTAAVVIAATALIWLLGTNMGLPLRFVFLFDMAAIAAFIWVFVVIWQIWQLRRKLNENGPR